MPVRGTGWLVASGLLLGGCAAPVPPVADDVAARQEAACAAAVATHVGKPHEAITTRLAARSGTGPATVEARDADRLHLCFVDGAARVLRLEHPGE